MKTTKSKTVIRREDRNKEYIDALQDKHSKLNVIRVDLYYDKNHKTNISLDEATDDFNRMMNNRRSKPSIFKDQVGYIVKKEYTPKRGVHFHAAFFYDGQKVSKDVYKAKQICEYWKKEITKNKGTANNCNLKAQKGEYGEDNAMGILKYKDKEQREKVDNAINYMCKDEQSIKQIDGSKKHRAIIRGTMPKSKGNIGRPRS